MRRRTPLLALILAPLGLWGLVLAWEHALLPLYVSLWHSDFAVRARLGSGDPETRAKALRDAVSVRPAEDALIGKLVEMMRADPERQVRADAANAMGEVGHRQPLPAEADQALGVLVLTEQDDAMLSAAVKAVGQARRRIGCGRSDATDRADFQRTASQWVYPAAAGARRDRHTQALPGEVCSRMRCCGTSAWRQENLARAFVVRPTNLPAPILDGLATLTAGNGRIRIHVLRRRRTPISQSKDLRGRDSDAREDVRSATTHGLKIIGQNAPRIATIAVALDRSLPVETRLRAMGRSKSIAAMRPGARRCCRSRGMTIPG
jgi:hypothetical protein